MKRSRGSSLNRRMMEGVRPWMIPYIALLLMYGFTQLDISFEIISFLALALVPRPIAQPYVPMFRIDFERLPALQNLSFDSQFRKCNV